MNIVTHSTLVAFTSLDTWRRCPALSQDIRKNPGGAHLEMHGGVASCQVRATSSCVVSHNGSNAILGHIRCVRVKTTRVAQEWHFNTPSGSSWCQNLGMLIPVLFPSVAVCIMCGLNHDSRHMCSLLPFPSVAVELSISFSSPPSPP